MADLLFAAGLLLLLLTAAGLAVLWRSGVRDADRMLGIQFLGSSGIAVLLLLAPAMEDAAILDAALLLALLAALAACAFRASARAGRAAPARETAGAAPSTACPGRGAPPEPGRT